MKPLYGLLPPDDPSAWAQLVAGGQPALERLVRLEPFEAASQPAVGPSTSAGPAVPPVGALGGRCSTPPPYRPQGTPERRRPPSPPPDAGKSPAGRAAQGRGAISPMRPPIPMEAALRLLSGGSSGSAAVYVLLTRRRGDTRSCKNVLSLSERVLRFKGCGCTLYSKVFGFVLWFGFVLRIVFGFVRLCSIAVRFCFMLRVRRAITHQAASSRSLLVHD